jgi:hypothetical protein
MEDFLRRGPSFEGLVSVETFISLTIPGSNELVAVRPPERGLGGRLDVRTPRGGCGKAFMLIVFRIVLPAAFTPGAAVALPVPGVVRSLGRPVFGGGVLVVDGALRPLLGRGVCSPIRESDGIVNAPILFRVLSAGKAGSADVGGPYDGRAGRGMVVAIVIVILRNDSCRSRC